MQIGNVKIEDPFILGPMAGATDRPARLLCREHGAGMVCMEMVSANAIKYGNKKTNELIHIDENEHPVSLQLFGPDPETIALAAEYVAKFPYDILDINMGCPMPKIVKNGEGSALMRDPALAGRIVEAAVKAQDRPVTVKMRKGYSANEINAVEVARIAEEAGAAAVAVHGRTREQLYEGTADWSIIKAVKEAVNIPVIGSGDAKDAVSAKAMLDETGCDAVMIARAARGNPWIFNECREYLKTGKIPVRPTIDELCETMLRHTKMQVEEKGDHIGVLEMRKHISWYVGGYPNAAELRRKINAAGSLAELENLIMRWREEVNSQAV